MIIGYARVSTHDQNLDSQLDALQKADCEQIFQEKITGKSKDRPELLSCLKALRKGDVLIVWKLDRLARSLKDLVEIITDLNQREIGFKSLTEAIDTTSATGRLVFHIFGALAEFERDIIRERTKAGLVAARARGRNGGRKPKMDDKKVAMALDLLDKEKHSVQEVCKVFKISKATLYRYLEKAKEVEKL